MKTVHLIRHAKSSWESTHLSDRQRPLSQRGIKDCKIMAGALFASGLQFNHVYCSTAQRAQLTIQGLAQHWQGPAINWQVIDGLYTFSSEQIKSLINALDDEMTEVFLVGHNPAFTDFINLASGANLANLPTCAYANLVFSVPTWQNVSHQTGNLGTFLKPKMFKKSTTL